MEKICSAKFGILIYLNRHEGRGIGLSNKIRAYAIQEEGYNTVEANVQLGFNVDSRDFSAAVYILQYLNINCIRLMTNNPSKVSALEENNIKVIERIPINSPVNAYNKNYLLTKKDLLGHMLEMSN